MSNKASRHQSARECLRRRRQMVAAWKRVVTAKGLPPDLMILPDDLIRDLGGTPEDHTEVVPGVRLVARGA